MASKVHDLIDRQDDLLARQYRFFLAPKRWRAYRNKTIRRWQLIRLHKASRANVPSRAGIYTMIVQPAVAKHPSCSYLMYVGQTVNLKKRFGEYLNRERRDTGRPKVFRMLNVYKKHVWFAFANVARNRLDSVEDDLIEAHFPPCNDQLPTSLHKVGNAF